MNGFVTDVVSSVPLFAVTDSDAWLCQQSEVVRAWNLAQGQPLQGNAALVIPAPEGHIAAVAVRVDTQAPVHALAALPSLLPEGVYALDPSGQPQELLPDLLLGWGLGAYQFNRYRKPRRQPAQLLWPVGDAALEEIKHQLEAVTLTRDLVNTPTEDMGPQQLSDVIEQLARRHSAEFRSVCGEALLSEGFPAIHAVGRASHREPRLLELLWGESDAPTLTLVGKGVCFDTGGLNIKGGEGMRNMKKDMGGAAHAIALAGLVMAQKLPVRLRLLVPAVENAIAANAFRPGEVVATRAGLSVEIDNTDAEGRMVLCDALALACESPPDLLIDFATLTGAARIALGPELPVTFSRDQELIGELLASGLACEDPLGHLPLHTPYMRFLESQIADLANSGASRHAGAITAALFLASFVPATQSWVHFDTYAWNDSDRPGHPRGGEAQGLRAVWDLLKQRYRA